MLPVFRRKEYLHTFICRSAHLPHMNWWTVSAINLFLYVSVLMWAWKYTCIHPHQILNIWRDLTELWVWCGTQKSIFLDRVHWVVYWPGIFCWPLIHPCLSGIWCACCCRGTEHEFTPKCFWFYSHKALSSHQAVYLDKQPTLCSASFFSLSLFVCMCFFVQVLSLFLRVTMYLCRRSPVNTTWSHL